MNWSWLVDSQFDSCDEQEVLDVLILQGKANKLGTKTWCTSELSTCFHVFSMQSQQQLSSGSWTFSTDFRSLSCLEVVSVTQVPRWGKLCWKSGEVKTNTLYNQRRTPMVVQNWGDKKLPEPWRWVRLTLPPQFWIQGTFVNGSGSLTFWHSCQFFIACLKSWYDISEGPRLPLTPEVGLRSTHLAWHPK